MRMAKKGTFAGKKHHNYKGGRWIRQEVICKECGESIIRIPALFKGTCKTCSDIKKLREINEKGLNFKRGAKHPRWKGGITTLRKKIRESKKYADWRLAVFKRDNFTCQNCGNKGRLVAHHLKYFENILLENNIKSTTEAYACEELWFISNGITLCPRCHIKVHS